MPSEWLRGFKSHETSPVICFGNSHSGVSTHFEILHMWYCGRLNNCPANTSTSPDRGHRLLLSQQETSTGVWCLRQNSRFCVLLLRPAVPAEDWVVWRFGLRARAASKYRTGMKYLEGLRNSKFSSPVGGAGTHGMKSKHPFCAIPGGKYQLSLFY